VRNHPYQFHILADTCHGRNCMRCWPAPAVNFYVMSTTPLLHRLAAHCTCWQYIAHAFVDHHFNRLSARVGRWLGDLHCGLSTSYARLQKRTPQYVIGRHCTCTWAEFPHLPSGMYLVQ